MESKDYAELFMLVKGAENALLSGQLTDWQHANTSTFHVLATMILDLNERLRRIELATIETATDKSLVDWAGNLVDGETHGG